MEGATSIDPSLFINCRGWKNKRRGGGSRRVGERKENEEGNRINAQSCRFKHRGFHKLALITRES